MFLFVVNSYKKMHFQEVKNLSGGGFKLHKRKMNFQNDYSEKKTICDIRLRCIRRWCRSGEFPFFLQSFDLRPNSFANCFFTNTSAQISGGFRFVGRRESMLCRLSF